MKTRRNHYKQRRSRRKQKAGAMSNTYLLLVASSNISDEDRERVIFLTQKLDELKGFQTSNTKRVIYIAISNVLSSIRSAYINSERIILTGSATLLEAISHIFDDLMEEFGKRLENPVKSCVPLPGRFGKPASCPTKNTATLETCIADTHILQKEAKRARRRMYEAVDLETGKAFIEKTMAFLRAVQSSLACRSFERLDTFAKNKGKRITGYISLFHILASAYLGEDHGTLIPKGNSNTASTISNASSVSYNNEYEY